MGELPEPAGSVLAVAVMALATVACRVGGVALMSRVRLTPRIERALRALPGCIVTATIVPIGLSGGPAAAVGLVAAVGAMVLVRHELAALAAGLATVAALRTAGL
jgi:uncharacterized membrane protein